MPDRLRVAARPRTPWEAADLGLALLRDQAGPVFRVWLATLAPLALALGLACHRRPWLAPLLLWWLKPLLARPVLHVLARSTFGEPPSLLRTLREAPGYCRRGVAATLLWRRLSLERGLLLPVWQLEAATGAGFRARRQVLLQRGGGAARLLTLVSLAFTGVLALGLLAGLDFFWPAREGPGLLATALAIPLAPAPWLLALLITLPTLAMAAVEPFYVACGYGLYLNRRVQLEAWDLEQAFRQLGARARRLLPGLLLALGLAWGLGLRAQPEPLSEPKAALREVLKAPEFSSRRVVWRLKGADRAAPRPAPVLPAWIEGLAAVLKLLIPGALVVLLGRALWLRRRGFLRPGAKVQAAGEPRFGQDLRPAALPRDLSGTALRLWDQGDPRAALALLYRGALAHLGRRLELPLGAGATEAECLRLAAALPQAGYLARLTAAWQAVAYGGQAPASQDRGLCTDWAGQFPPPEPGP